MSDLISREYMKSLGATCIASRSKDGTLFPIVAIDELPPADPTHPTPSNTLGALDCVDRQAAVDARRYTFGNDEFSLEAAYHDCKLVFDGITDDDSFQEADTGLILYYANEIIYALQEALEGKDTNVPSNDYISRQAAIDALKICDNNEDGINCYKCPLRDERWDGAWQDDETNCYTKLMRDSAKLLEMPSSQPRKGKWHGKGDSEGYGIFICDNCGKFAMMEFDFCPNCGADMRPQFEEPEINPCRGCEDYDGKGGCKTKGGCADRRGDLGD